MLPLTAAILDSIFDRLTGTILYFLASIMFYCIGRVLVFMWKVKGNFVDYRVSFISKKDLIVFELLTQTYQSLWGDENNTSPPSSHPVALHSYILSHLPAGGGKCTAALWRSTGVAGEYSVNLGAPKKGKWWFKHDVSLVQITMMTWLNHGCVYNYNSDER